MPLPPPTSIDALPLVLTTRQFAAVFQVSPSTVLGWYVNGLIQPICGTRYRWSRDMVAKMIRMREPVDALN